MSHQKIAFFGLGNMGSGMVGRLLGAGHEVTVWNRNAERAEGLRGRGAKIARTPREAAAVAEVLIAMVADDDASRTVWLGDQGALAGAVPGAMAVDCSTLSVPWVRELANEAGKKSVRFIDAPVTGTKPHAANGELTFLVGGDTTVLEALRPVLKTMSKEILHLGPVGAGAALKLINNFLAGVQAASLAEALAMIKREGLDEQAALPLIVNGNPGSPLVKTLTGRHTSGDANVYFSMKLLAKDVAYAQAEAKRIGVDLKTAAAALAQLQGAMAAGLGDRDMSAILAWLKG